MVGVGTCWPWEAAATLPSAGRRTGARRPRGRRGAGAYRGGRPPTACFIYLQCFDTVGWVAGRQERHPARKATANVVDCDDGDLTGAAYYLHTSDSNYHHRRLRRRLYYHCRVSWEDCKLRS